MCVYVCVWYVCVCVCVVCVCIEGLVPDVYWGWGLVPEMVCECLVPGMEV